MVSIVTRNYISLFTIGLISLSACTTLSVPDWVEGKSERYTNKAYLLGHGVGQNPEIAEENASQKITKQFKSISTSDELTSQTKIIFNQIEFEEPWLNTDTSQHHVLAYISRDKVASLIQGKMLALDELTYQFFEQAKETDDLLEQTSYIDSAVNAQNRRLKLKSLLEMITTEYDSQSSYNVKRLSKLRDKLLSRINLQIDFSGDKLGNLESIIKTNLDAAGFIRNEKKSSQNHLAVELKIDESIIPETSNELLLQGILTISIRHKGDDTIRGTHRWTFNTTARNHNSIVEKAQDFLKEKLSANLKRVIMDMMIIEYDTQSVIPNQDYVDFDMPEFNTPNDSNTSNNSGEKATTLKTKPESSVTVTKPDSLLSKPAVKKPIVTKAAKTEAPKLEKAPENNKVKTTETTPTDIINSKPVDTNNSTVVDEKPTENTIQNSITDTDDPISTLPPLAN